MRLLLTCLCVCVTAAVELSCNHPQCDDSKVSYVRGRREFTVEGHKIKYAYEDKRNKNSFNGFSVDCDGWPALDSSAMPRFASEFRTSVADLSNCPLPTRNVSIVGALAALNVVLQPVDNRLDLDLDLSESPENRLTPQHFVGLDQLTHIEIEIPYGYGLDPHQRPTAVAGSFAGLRSLRTLHLVNVRLAAAEIERLPHSITRLWLQGQSINSLPSTLPEILLKTQLALPNMKFLLLNFWQFTAPDSVDTNDVKLQLSASSLESIQLLDWPERRPTPLKYCDVLRSLEFRNSKFEELPDRWVAACPLLEELLVDQAEQLTSLPAKLLDGANSLKRLTFRLTKLRTLPDRFLEGAPMLQKLYLVSNRIRTLPSDVFLGPALRSLSLEDNKLGRSQIAALAPLVSLRHLNLAFNGIFDLCEENGYSPLANLTQLKSFSLSETIITHICRDWREKFTLLETLNLHATNIRSLKITDFLYTRDASVDARVKLSSSVTSMDFTREDYETALTAPGPGATLEFSTDKRLNMIRDVNCDCRTYWLRRALDSASRAIRVDGLRCSNQRSFLDMTADDMCPELATAA